MTFQPSFFSQNAVLRRKLTRRLRGVVSIRSPHNKGKWALLSYTTHPFTITKKELDKTPHTNPWECLIITEILLERGYNVHVIDWTNKKFLPKKNYQIVIDIHQNLERLAPLLPPGTIKIFYATGAHPSYQNSAEQKRLRNLKERRGCEISTARQVPLEHAMKYADHATALGDGFSKETYGHQGERMINIPLLTIVTFSNPEDKDYASVKNNFVWIGGGGAVHKGLDLVLEAFAQMPEYNLTVCGPIEKESDFIACYEKELSLPNIHQVGRIDVRGDLFRDITRNAVGLVYPSCSEGQSGSVITGMHAGLIPIITKQAGVHVVPFGIELQKASVAEIIIRTKEIATLSVDELRTRSIKTWNHAQKHHSKEEFKRSYSAFIDDIIKEK